MIAAGLARNGVAAVRHMRRDHDEIAGVEDVLRVIAPAAGLAFHYRANRELGVTMTFIRHGTLPRAAQLKARKAVKGLADLSGMVIGAPVTTFYTMPWPY